MTPLPIRLHPSSATQQSPPPQISLADIIAWMGAKEFDLLKLTLENKALRAELAALKTPATSVE